MSNNTSENIKILIKDDLLEQLLLPCISPSSHKCGLLEWEGGKQTSSMTRTLALRQRCAASGR